jgi:hypothetical protein
VECYPIGCDHVVEEVLYIPGGPENRGKKRFGNPVFMMTGYGRMFSDYITGPESVEKIIFTMWLGENVMKIFSIKMRIGKKVTDVRDAEDRRMG